MCISDAQRVSYIWPHRGSSNGATRITIVGEGKELIIEVERYKLTWLKVKSHFKSDYNWKTILDSWWFVFSFFPGFAQERQFQLNPENENFGNTVTLVSSTLSVPCDVERDSTHANQIMCYSRQVFFFFLFSVSWQKHFWTCTGDLNSTVK